MIDPMRHEASALVGDGAAPPTLGVPRDLGFPDLGRLGVGSRPGLFGPKARWSGVS
ncbi:LOW QUALITY PROTEIN: hypothetical protein YC2023_031976 [Brassica napus]